MNKRGQAAMEFLMTYGWAIVVVLAAIGALAYFGVLSPSKLLPDRTTFTAPIAAPSNGVVDLAGQYIEVGFVNNVGTPITINRNTVVTASQYCTGTPAIVNVTDSLTKAEINTTTQISNGGKFLIRWSCVPVGGAKIGDKIKADITFEYTETEMGQTKKQSGSIESKFV